MLLKGSNLIKTWSIRSDCLRGEEEVRTRKKRGTRTNICLRDASLSIIWLACLTACHTCHNCDNPLFTRHTKPFARRGKDNRPSGTPPWSHAHRPPGRQRPTRLSHHVTPPLSHVSQHLSHVTSFVTHATPCHVTFLFPSEHLSHVTSVTSPIYRDVTLVTKTCSVFFVSQCDKIVIDWFIVI